MRTGPPGCASASVGRLAVRLEEEIGNYRHREHTVWKQTPMVPESK